MKRTVCNDAGSCVKEFSQLVRRLELRNRIELLESACERVRQARHRALRELRVFRLEVQPVHFGQKTPGSVEGAVDERAVENQFCALVGDLSLPPQLRLALHRLDVPLDAVYSNGERIDQVEALTVLRQDRREIA